MCDYSTDFEFHLKNASFFWKKVFETIVPFEPKLTSAFCVLLFKVKKQTFFVNFSLLTTFVINILWQYYRIFSCETCKSIICFLPTRSLSSGQTLFIPLAFSQSFSINSHSLFARSSFNHSKNNNTFPLFIIILSFITNFLRSFAMRCNW